jgi:hypothetical protein
LDDKSCWFHEKDGNGKEWLLIMAAALLDCAGRAQRRRRFRTGANGSSRRELWARESGVALRLPPQSKTRKVRVSPAGMKEAAPHDVVELKTGN